MNHPLRCECSAVQGYISHPEQALNRGVCYCLDCQTYAHFLGRPTRILDPLGGTDIVGVLPKNITITQGFENIACMSLSEKGMLRWYARCCSTPIGNTPRDNKTYFMGVVHTCLHDPDMPIETSFGPVQAWVNTKNAKGKTPGTMGGTFRAIARHVRSVLRSRFNGDYKITPFFTERGSPVKILRVLSTTERARFATAAQK